MSIPVDVTGDAELVKLEEKGVRGRYVSVEHLQEVDGKVIWQMATSSTPGGSIPSFIAESSIPGQISAVRISPTLPSGCAYLTPQFQDVPHFIKWFHSVRSKTTTTTTPSEPQQDAESAPTT